MMSLSERAIWGVTTGILAGSLWMIRSHCRKQQEDYFAVSCASGIGAFLGTTAGCDGFAAVCCISLITVVF